MSYIYITTNNLNNKQYIGKSTKNSKDNKSYLGGGDILVSAIKKHGRKNFEKKIIVEGDFNTNLLNELEIHYIRLYNADQSDMFYNVSKGGYYDLDHVKSFSEKKGFDRTIYSYNSEGILLQTFNGTKEASDYYKLHRLTLSNAINKKYKCGGYFFTDFLTLIKPVPKTIIKGQDCYVYSLEGQLVNIFPSIKKCARELNIELEKVRNAIKTRFKINEYYIFRTQEFNPKIVRSYSKPLCIYNDNECLIFYSQKELSLFLTENKIDNLSSNSLKFKLDNKLYKYRSLWNKSKFNSNDRKSKRIIVEYDLNGNKIAEWKSSPEAALYYNISSSPIRCCCRNEKKTYKNKIWKYET